MVIEKKCCDCKRCNRKGKPSVTRNSEYCRTHFVENNPSIGFFASIKKNLLNRFKDKEGNQFPVNGFRTNLLKRVK